MAWALAAVALLLSTYPMSSLAPWRGFLLAIPFLIATAGLGWRAGVVLAPIGLFLAWLGPYLGAADPTSADYLMLVLAMGVATAGGDRLYRAWRRAEQAARHAGRRAKLLQEATRELNLATDRDALFHSAPRLLADILPFAHAAVFIPAGGGLRVHTAWRWGIDSEFEVPLSSVMGRALLTRTPQYVKDTHLDPDFIQAPGAEFTRSELALPIFTGREVRAIFNVEHRNPHAFSDDDQAALAAFVRMISEVLVRLDATEALTEKTGDQEFMARLQHRLLLAETVAETAEVALDEILSKFDFDLGVVLELHHARLRPVAVRGSPPPTLAQRIRDGFPFTGLLRYAWESRELVLVDDLSADGQWVNSTEARAVAALPIVDQAGQVQALLAVTRFRDPLPQWDERTRQLLSAFSAPLGATFARCTLNRQLFATLDAIRQLKSAEGPEMLYHQAAKATFNLVPYAEAVSILVRHGEHYHFEAALGYDLNHLQTEAGPFTVGELLNWHGGDPESFWAGHGRILRGPEILRVSGNSLQSPAASSEGRVAEMRCQLAVPIVDQGKVVALLNIDNFSSEDAFGPAALRVAEAFAQHVTVVVRQADEMLALERYAVTDALTGLGNREGFDRSFKQELARARRYDHHLSLILLDLNDFKQINDRFGHPEGDRALKLVAEAIRSAARGTDLVFRWGGDEFAILLPEVQLHEAALAATRMAGVVGRVDVNGVRLSASLGVATYPTDGLDPSALIDAADRNMYRDKRRRSGESRSGEGDHARRQASEESLGGAAGGTPSSSLAEPPPTGPTGGVPGGEAGGTPVNAGRVSR